MDMVLLTGLVVAVGVLHYVQTQFAPQMTGTQKSVLW
jgi:hypothetical protein